MSYFKFERAGQKDWNPYKNRGEHNFIHRLSCLNLNKYRAESFKSLFVTTVNE